MIRNHRYFAAGLCATVFALARSAMADGYRNPPPTAEGIAKSGVHSVWVDDASAIFYNPANLAFQTNQSVVLSLTMARTENSYQNPLAPNAFESDGDWNFLPNIYYALPLGERWTAGLSINTPYGQGLSWEKDDFAPFIVNPGDFVPYEAQMMMINFNPTVATKLTDTLSLGAGLNVAYSELTLKSLLGTGEEPMRMWKAKAMVGVSGLISV
ncbi:hypothetical protein EGM51_13810 [Verrucomicrobia bacterium S94]|nr:hypothetical protein EGM51_13810 [Verrucomicrobia bacterium S94]